MNPKNHINMYELKTEVLEICEAFKLGSYIGFKTVSSNVDGYIKSEFKTSKGTYTHFYKVKN